MRLMNNKYTLSFLSHTGLSRHFSAGSDRPHRRTALVGRELDRYKVEIAALSDTTCRGRALKRSWRWLHFLLEWTQERGACEAVVGFAIKSHLVSELSGLPKNINDHLVNQRFPLSGKRHATIVSVYAPTMTNPDAVKDKLCDDLVCIVCNTPDRQSHPPRGLQCQSGHRLPNLGRSNWNWRSREVQWPFFLKEVCRVWTTDHQHSHPSTNSQQNITSLHLRSKHWHLIDYVIVPSRKHANIIFTPLNPTFMF